MIKGSRYIDLQERLNYDLFLTQVFAACNVAENNSAEMILLLYCLVAAMFMSELSLIFYRATVCFIVFLCFIVFIFYIF